MSTSEPEDRAHNLEMKIRLNISQTVSSIEVALAKWERNKDKPKELESKIRYLKAVHRMLLSWQKKSLKGKTGHNSIIKRLEDFKNVSIKMGALKRGMLYGGP